VKGLVLPRILPKRLELVIRCCTVPAGRPVPGIESAAPGSPSSCVMKGVTMSNNYEHEQSF
jgi:hypothetical protein